MSCDYNFYRADGKYQSKTFILWLSSTDLAKLFAVWYRLLVEITRGDTTSDITILDDDGQLQIWCILLCK